MSAAILPALMFDGFWPADEFMRRTIVLFLIFLGPPSILFSAADTPTAQEFKSIQEVLKETAKLTNNDTKKETLKYVRKELDRVRQLWDQGYVPNTLSILMNLRSILYRSASGETPSDVPLDLSISTSAATRVRILADDKLLLDSELPAGETRHFTAKQRFEVSATNSSAVLLQLNGKAMPPLGAPGASGRMVYGHSNLR